MREFDNVKDMVYDEIEHLSSYGQLTKDAICVLGELVDILKDIGTVEMFEEGYNFSDDEYSLASGYGRNGGDGGYSRRNSYRGNSYNYRNGSGYGRGGYNRGRYSREDGKEHMIQQLHNIMNEA